MMALFSPAGIDWKQLLWEIGSRRLPEGDRLPGRRLTTAQALVAFLKNQQVERDGRRNAFFAGMWGIFGHGCVAGVGQALQENLDFPYYLARNEQAAVHIATGFAKANLRLKTFACTSSIGPGATNMVTGAATATINRLPVLLLPGDIFARRNVAPVLQQLESEHTQDISVNDAFRSVSRYWDRINRPDQLPYSMLEAMRVLTSPAETGAVVLSLPQDVQTEAWDYPAELFEERIWQVPRPRGDAELVKRAADWIRAAMAPLIIAGGGVLYSEAASELARFALQTGIPVTETQAGKGSLPFDHPQNAGAIGVTGTPGANILARHADLVIAIGTRLSDFTTASTTAFQNPSVRFINVNVAEFDAFKNGGLPIVMDARVALEELAAALAGHRVSVAYASSLSEHKRHWEEETDRLFNLRHGPPLSQSEVIGAVADAARPEDVVVCAAGSLPGDLHKLWRARRPGGYHMEYGYSCMGYEIAGGLGVKMADPSRQVWVMIGDGSFLMMSSEIVTSIQEGYPLNIVLLDNHGFGSIGGLSHSIGSEGFGTEYRMRSAATGQLDGEYVPVDFVAIACGMGAYAVRVKTNEELVRALAAMRDHDRTSVVVVETDRELRVGGYESWWDVAIAEVSNMPSVRNARAEYEAALKKEKTHVLAPRKNDADP
jgi:3D-(3,5/4)-trihydroxycyclohexane-1,2-dione acylhydrolase (decyclizing)